jgi:hypothetical protein
MATSTRLDLDLQRRLALESMPPSELRDDYLCYLDGLERTARARAERVERAEEPATTPPGDEAHRGSIPRYVVAAVGSLAFAVGTWLVTSLL